MNYKRTIILLSISIITVVLATAGITYAYLSFSAVQATPNVLNSACFDLAISDSSYINYIGYPMSQATAFQNLKPYNLTITNTCTDVVNTSYKVVLNVLNDSSPELLPHIKYSTNKSTSDYITKLETISLPSTLIEKSSTVLESYIVAEGNLDSTKKSASHVLYLWLDENACNGNECQTSIMGKKFSAQISVYSEAT